MLSLLSAVLAFSFHPTFPTVGHMRAASSSFHRNHQPVCSIRRVVESTMEVEVPKGVGEGDDVVVTASDGQEVCLPVPTGLSGGDVIVYAEVPVPAGCEPGDSITVVVADPGLDVQVFEVEVPEEYTAGDMMLVVVDGAQQQKGVVDWDAAWVDFRAASTRRASSPTPLQKLREDMKQSHVNGHLDTAHTVAVTIVVAYAILCRAHLLRPSPSLALASPHSLACPIIAVALHASGGIVIVPDGEFGIRTETMVQLSPFTQWQLRGAL